MKRIISFAAVLAMVFGSAACQKEVLKHKEGDSKVTFKVAVPVNESVTKAEMSDGSNADILYYEAYVGETLMHEGELKDPIVNSDGDRQFELTLNLVNEMTYDILFWAQNSTVGYYNVSDLRAVTVDYTGTANDEKRDAFFGACLGFESHGIASEETVKLTRPFAQINFATSPDDWKTAENFIQVDGLKSQVTFPSLPNKFNVKTGDIVADSWTTDPVTMTFAQSPATEGVYSNNEISYKGINYAWVAMNYILAPKSESSMDKITAQFVHDKNDQNSALKKEVINVPFKQNYRTNILGEIFAGGNKFNVVIVSGFANDPIEDYPDYTIAEPLMFALEHGGSVTLEEDMTLPRNFTTKKNVVINLNGHKLSYDQADINNKPTFIMVRVEDGGSLIINDNGKTGSEIVSNGYVASANTGGKIVVNGGTFTANTTTFQANGGEVYINGGEFKIDDPTDTRYVLNHIDAMNKQGLISVSGGKFHGFNPAAGNSENPNMNFLAEGYEAVEETAGVWTVKANADVVTLEGDVKTVATIQATGLVGNAKKIEADFSATKSEYIVHGKVGGKIENVTITGSNKRNVVDKVQRGIFLSDVTDDVTIDNVNISRVAYTINTGSNIDATKTLTVTNSTLEGWTSPASFASVEFEKCEFKIGTYYVPAAGADRSWNGCFRAATTTVLKECVFEKGFYISLATMVKDGTLTLKDCTCDGVKLNADNIADYLNEAEAGTLKMVKF